MKKEGLATSVILAINSCDKNDVAIKRDEVPIRSTTALDLTFVVFISALSWFFLKARKRYGSRMVTAHQPLGGPRHLEC